MSDYVTPSEFNGLGARVNVIEKECAACQADKNARLSNVDLRQNSQNDDIKRLFEKFDELKASFSKMAGGISVLIVVLQVALFIVDKMVK